MNKEDTHMAGKGRTLLLQYVGLYSTLSAYMGDIFDKCPIS